MSIVTNVLMDRGEASRRRIPQPCIKAVEQWARCKEDACEILDQCDGMRGYLTPDIVVAVTSRYYSQRQVDRARSVAMDYLTKTHCQGRPTKPIQLRRQQNEKALAEAEHKLTMAISGMHLTVRQVRDPMGMTSLALQHHAHHAPTEHRARRQSVQSVVDPADSDDDVGPADNDDDFEAEVVGVATAAAATAGAAGSGVAGAAASADAPPTVVQ